MNIGQRVAKLRISHGESLRAAAIRTGVSHSTIARIEKGEVTGSYHITLERIAQGYGIPTEYLLTGRSSVDVPTPPRLDSEEVAMLLLTPSPNRMLQAYRFLTNGKRGSLPADAFAAALDTDRESLEQELSGDSPLLPEREDRLCQQMSALTGLSPAWFRPVQDSQGDRLSHDDVGSFLTLVGKAHRAGITPELLAIAVDLLLLKAEVADAPTEVAHPAP